MNLDLIVFLSRDNLPRIKYGLYLINLNYKQSKGTYQVSLFVVRNTSVHFDSFGMEYIPQDVLNKIKDKFFSHNILRIIQSDYSIMCGFY